jgi:site-specific DNA-methyltransferase (adenine-specific)
MKRYPDVFFDLAIVDPPFSIGRGNGSFGRGGRKSKQPKKYRKDLENYVNHNVLPNKEYFDELFRVSKNQIIWGANYYPQYLYHSGWIFWDKCKKDGLMSQGELAFQSFDKKIKVFKHEWEGFRKAKSSFFEGEPKTIIHPNQKPIALYDWCFEQYAKEGYKILDTHLGSGSSRISAYKKGFYFVGCELSEKYFNNGCERFNRFIETHSKL